MVSKESMMPQSPQPQSFAPTRWTLVKRATVTSPEGRAALSELCEAYYQPVFGFMRRIGWEADLARDHTHSFFAHLLERGFPGADPAKGRFRNYLLGAVKYFVGDLRDHSRREKRGGGQQHEDVDELEIPDAKAAEASELFDREWAMAVINRALAALAREQASRRPSFEVIRPWLMGDAVGSQAQTAAQLSISEGAFKVAVHRLRKRFRDHLRHEVQQTLDDDADVEEELRYLSSVLR